MDEVTREVKHVTPPSQFNGLKHATAEDAIWLVMQACQPDESSPFPAQIRGAHMINHWSMRLYLHDGQDFVVTARHGITRKAPIYWERPWAALWGEPV